MIAKSGPEGIPARNGDAFGSATVTLFEFNGETPTESEPAKVFNLASIQVPPNTWLLLEKVGEHWFVNFRDWTLGFQV